jgi:serine/tyrosine/threonine adenylyltransferase
MKVSIKLEIANGPITQNRYCQLPPDFFDAAMPDAAPAPRLIALNHGLITGYGLDAAWFETGDALEVFSGRATAANVPPIALAYSGHQFGGWSPLLGDGRAHMLGQMPLADGGMVDVQLKGSGSTRFSRGGDGKATLASVLREYLVSEAMAGLGIPATRALAVIATGETVYRNAALPGAILVRTAESHIRVGSFQFAAANLGPDGVRALADYMLDHHFAARKDTALPYEAMLEDIVARQAILIAKWMGVGFIHGVINTDNMSIVGETIDFGPCALMDEFRANKVFSSIDANGRYAWNKQAAMALWNLTRLAEAMLPLFGADETQSIAIAERILGAFSGLFDRAYQNVISAKLGLAQGSPGVTDLTQKLFALLGADQIDFTQFFDRLTAHAGGAEEVEVIELFGEPAGITSWLAEWRSAFVGGDEKLRLMRQANPAIIARNHMVERALADATERGDFVLFNRLSAALASPGEVTEANRDLTLPPAPEERVRETFCGT